MWSRECPNCKQILELNEYTENNLVCKGCGVPLVLSNWVISTQPFSGFVMIPLFAIVFLLISLVLPESISEYTDWVFFILFIILAYIFSFKIVPAVFSDLSVDYKRAKEYGVTDKIKKSLRL